MKIWIPILALAVLAPLIGASRPTGDDRPSAHVVDSKGVSTFVTGLQYCFEEEEEGELYETKHDDLFVRRGDALIRVGLDSVVRVNFTGRIERDGEERLFEARITTRRGGEVTADLLCHRSGFIKGCAELGEFRIDLERIASLTFDGDHQLAPPSVRCILPDAQDSTPSPAPSRIRLDADGRILGLEGETEGAGSGAERAAPRRVLLDVDGGVSYAMLRSALRRLADRGIEEVVLGR